MPVNGEVLSTKSQGCGESRHGIYSIGEMVRNGEVLSCVNPVATYNRSFTDRALVTEWRLSFCNRNHIRMNCDRPSTAANEG